VEVAEEIKEDIKLFIERIYTDRPDLKNLKIRETSFEEMIELILSIYS
jgi:hypothetical protein